jgi:3-hydroxyacyl-[acyl-carrier-protein] dehydratase
MVLNSLFKLKAISANAAEIKADLFVDGEHRIFEGHFPGQPVVPGVCMMQLVKELVELSRKTKLNLHEADNVKFLAVIDPRLNNELSAVVSMSGNESAIAVTASLFADTVTFFKLKAILKPVGTAE